MYTRLSRVDQHQSIDEQHPVYKCSVNSSQQWQHKTAQCLMRRPTRHNTVFQPPVNSSYDFGLWRVDRVTSWLAPMA